MTGLQVFATFGLPALAICGALLGLVVTQRSAARIDASAAERARRASGG